MQELHYSFINIRIFNGCEVRIENFIARETVWNYKAC